MLVILIAGGYFAFKYTPQGPSEDERETTAKEEQVFCAQDTQLCRDGSYVHRVAPSCNFQKCKDGSVPPANTPVFEDGTVSEETAPTTSASNPL